MARVSVVIPTFERAARLPGLVAALEAQSIPLGDFEVIVADDGSRDETQAVLADLAARTRLALRVVRNATNSGPGRARNLAWRSSDAPIIAFTDDDCLPDPGWLEAGLGFLEDTSVGIFPTRRSRTRAGRRRFVSLDSRRSTRRATSPIGARSSKKWAGSTRRSSFSEKMLYPAGRRAGLGSPPSSRPKRSSITQ
ncbi:MAG: glycosyltransferase family 2 protein [Actinobacteria bacterium]|nr:MAG: glycosyltransferase family 2 protein [Actinomycetota bacterium]